MLSKQNRADKKNVEKVFKNGLFLVSRNLTFKYVKNKPGENETKISFVVPKSVSKKAVCRNLLKRRGYYIMAKHFKKIPFKITGIFVFGKKSVGVFGGRKNKSNNPIQNLENEIKDIVSKIH